MYKLKALEKKTLLGEFSFQFSRSSGPGGQKVNKTESQVELRWSVGESQAFDPPKKQRILEKLSNQINNSQELVLTSDQYRSRERNKDAVIQRCIDYIEKALHIPKKRKATKPTRSSIEKRLQSKKIQSEKKQNRQKW